MAPPVAEYYGEMAFIAHHFHWSSETLLTMEHAERRRWCRDAAGTCSGVRPAVLL